MAHTWPWRLPLLTPQALGVEGHTSHLIENGSFLLSNSFCPIYVWFLFTSCFLLSHWYHTRGVYNIGSGSSAWRVSFLCSFLYGSLPFALLISPGKFPSVQILNGEPFAIRMNIIIWFMNILLRSPRYPSTTDLMLALSNGPKIPKVEALHP